MFPAASHSHGKPLTTPMAFNGRVENRRSIRQWNTAPCQSDLLLATWGRGRASEALCWGRSQSPGCALQGPQGRTLGGQACRSRNRCGGRCRVPGYEACGRWLSGVTERPWMLEVVALQPCPPKNASFTAVFLNFR